MSDLIKNVMISFLIIAATLIAIFLILFLRPTIGIEEQVLTVRFNNIDKISVGTRVTFAGKTVGEVDTIQIIQKNIDEKVAHKGLLYVYELGLKIDKSVNVYNIDDIVIASVGLLGEKYIDIIPKLPKKGETYHRVNDQIIYAEGTHSLEGTIKDALTEIREIAEDIKNRQIVAHTSETIDHLRSIAKSVDDPKAWKAIVGNLDTLFDSAVTSWPSVDYSLENMKKITDNSDVIVAKVSKGEGTAGRLIMSDDLYLKFNALLNKGDIIMNDINHYGLLFHTDKGWQRLRARRLNLMQQLRSPQEFRNYFNDEIDQISTSLNRVSMVLAMTQDDFYCCQLLDNREFAKVFAELMRRVNTLDEEIKSYNIQIFEDCSVYFP